MEQLEPVKSFLKKAIENEGKQYDDNKALKLIESYNYDYTKLVDDIATRAGFKPEEVPTFRERAFKQFGITPIEKDNLEELDFLSITPEFTDDVSGYDKYEGYKAHRDKLKSYEENLKSKLRPEIEDPSIPPSAVEPQSTITPPPVIDKITPQQFDTEDDVKRYNIQSRIADITKKKSEVEKIINEQARLNKKQTGFVSAAQEATKKQFDVYDEKLGKAIEERNVNATPMLSKGVGSATPQYIYKYQDAQKVRDLRDIKSTYKKIGKILGSPEGSSDQLRGLAYGLLQSNTAKDFFTLGINEMGRNLNVKNAFDKQQAGKELNEEEEALIEAYTMLKQTEQITDKNMGAIVGEGLQDMIPFIAEFALTSGTGTAAKKITQEFIESTVKNKILGKVGGSAAKVATQAAIMPTTYKGYAERIAPVLGEEGELVEGQNKGEALLKAYLTTAAEVVGEDVAILGQRALRNRAIRKLADNPNTAQKFMSDVALRLSSETGVPTVQGVPFEVLSEEVTGVLQAAIDQDGSFFTADAQKQLLLMTSLAGGGASAFSIPNRVATKKSYQNSVQLLNDIPNANYTEAVQNATENITDPEELINTFDKISKDNNVSEQDYYKARNYIANSIKYNQMNNARAITIEKGIAEFKDNDGNITTTNIDGQKWYIRNSNDLGVEDKAIFAKNDAGEVRTFPSIKITEWQSQTPDEVKQDIDNSDNLDDLNYEEVQNMKSQASEKGIDVDAVVETPEGKGVVSSVNDDGTVTVETDKGEEIIASIEETEPFKTKDEIEAEKEQAKLQEKMLEGIKEGAQPVSDESEVLTNGEEIRVIDFDNGQSKLIQGEEETIFNNLEERDNALNKLFAPEIAQEEGKPDLESMTPEERYNTLLEEDEEVATEMLSYNIQEIREQADFLRTGKVSSQTQKIQNLKEAKQLEKEAQQLEEILNRPANQRMVDQAESLAIEYTQEQETAPANNLEEWQIDALTRKFNRDSFTRFGDRNQITPELTSKWLKPKKSQNVDDNIDIAAQELSDIAGKEITPQDIVDLISQFPTKDVPKITERMKDIEAQYKDLTNTPIQKHDKFKEEIGLEPFSDKKYEEEVPGAEQTPQADIEEAFGPTNVKEEDEAFRLREKGEKVITEPETANQPLTEGSLINISDRASTDLKTRQNAQKALDKISRELNQPAEILNSEEIPEAVKAEEKRRIAEGQEAVGFYHDGTIYIISDRITSVIDAKKTFLHESIVHNGLKGLFENGNQEIIGKQYSKFQDLMNDVYTSLSPEEKLNIAKNYFSNTYNQYYDEKGNEISDPSDNMKAYIAEEFMAELSELESIPTKWQEFVDKLVQIIRKTFNLTSKQFTKSDLLNIIKDQRSRMNKSTSDNVNISKLTDSKADKTIIQAGMDSANKESDQIKTTSDDVDTKFRTAEQSKIIQDARSYPSYEEFIDAYEEKDFRDMHSAPGDPQTDMSLEERMDEGSDFNLVEVSQGYSVQPSDYFDPRFGARYYGYQDYQGQQSYQAIREVMDNINEQVMNEEEVTNIPSIMAYRAVPNDLNVNELKDRDWITFSEEYAVSHGKSRFGEDAYRIIEEEVPADKVWWDGNDINEWGYDTGKTESLGRSDLKRIWEEANKISEEAKFRIIGEQGAEVLDKIDDSINRLNNLSSAKKMEKEGKSILDIRMATGWERGADKKWRYETPDFEVKTNMPKATFDMAVAAQEEIDKLNKAKDFDADREKLILFIQDVYNRLGVNVYDRDKGRQISKALKENDISLLPSGSIAANIEEGSYLNDIIEDKELFEMYPSFKNIYVYPEDISNGAFFSPSKQQIGISKSYFSPMDNHESESNERDLRKILAHEIQHAIQREEGFATGGSVSYFKKQYQDLMNRIDWYNTKLKEASIEGRKEAYQDLMERKLNLVEESQQYIDAYGNVGRKPYRSLSGEVEARNVERRIDYHDAQRKVLTLLDTEDVARKDQVSIRGPWFGKTETMFRVADSQKELDDFVKDSKVKETVYHGTDKLFDDFKMQEGAMGKGAYFTSVFEEAADYASEKLGIPLSEENDMGGDWIGTYIKEARLNITDENDITNSKYGDGKIYLARTPDQILIEPKEELKFRQSEARKEVNTDPTEAQKSAGNYKMGHVRFDGFDISIENPKGSTRKGVDDDGFEWANTLPADYGYFKGTIGKDKDHIDVYLGDNLESDKVYVIDQINPKTGKFDEHKVMMGFDNVSQAKRKYNEAYDKGWEGLGNITRTTKKGLKDWFENGNTKKEFAVQDTKFKISSTNPQTQKLLDDFYKLQEESKLKEKVTELSDELKGKGKVEKQQIQNRIKDIREGGRLAKKDVKGEIKSIQSMIVNYAKEMIPTGEAGSRDVGSLLTAVKNAQTPAAIEKAFDKIDELSDKVTGRTQRIKDEKRIGRLLKWMTNYRKQGNTKAGKFEYETVKLFDELRDTHNEAIKQAKIINYTKTTDQEKTDASNRLEEMWNTINDKEDKTLVDDVTLKLIELRRHGSKASNALVESIKDDLQVIYDNAKEAKTTEDIERAVKRKDEREFVKNFVKDNKYKDKNILGKFGVDINNFTANVMGNWETLMTMLGGNKARDKFSLILNQVEEEMGIQTSFNEVLDKAQKGYGFKSKNEMLKHIQDLKKKDFSLVKPLRSGKRGEGSDLEISKMQIIDIYNAIKNDEIREDFYLAYGDIVKTEDGYDREAQKEIGKQRIDELIGELDDRDKTFGDEMQRKLDEYYDSTNKVFVQLFNRDLPKVDNYWPSSAEFKTEKDVFNQFMNESNHPSATKERTGMRSPKVDNTDAFDKFTKHVKNAEWYKNMAIPIENLNKTFTDLNVSDLITENRGKKFQETIVKHIENQGLNASTRDLTEFERKGGNILGNWVSSKIGLTPSVPLKQLTSVINYAENMPPHKWLAGFTKGLLTPQKTFKEMWDNIPYLQTRFEKGYSEALEYAMNASSGLPKARNWQQAIKNIETIGTRSGDIAAIVFGGKPYIDYLINEKGMEKKDAYDRFMLETLRSQQSPFSSSLSQYQNSKNPFAKALFTFANTPSQYMRKMFEANQAYKHGDINAKQLAKIYSIYGLANQFLYIGAGALISAMMKGSDPDEDLWEKTIAQSITSLVGGLPLVRDLAQSTSKQLLGLKVYDDALPVMEELGKLIEYSVKTVKGEGETDKNVYEATKILLELGGLSAGNAEKLYKATVKRDETFKETRSKKADRDLKELSEGKYKKAELSKELRQSYSNAKRKATKLEKEGKISKANRLRYVVTSSKADIATTEYTVTDLKSEIKRLNSAVNYVD